MSKDAIEWTPLLTWIGITETDRREWHTAYPACDIDVELVRMTCWLRANPAKAHKKLWRRFITNWLTRQQERGGGMRSRPMVQDSKRNWFNE